MFHHFAMNSGNDRYVSCLMMSIAFISQCCTLTTAQISLRQEPTMEDASSTSLTSLPGTELHTIAQSDDIKMGFQKLGELQKDVNSLDDLGDIVVSEIGMMLKSSSLDPLELPDYEKDCTMGLLGCRIILSNGTGLDVSNIVRDGSLQMNYQQRKLTVKIPVTFPSIKFNYYYSMDEPVLSGTVDGSSDDVKVLFVFVIDFARKQVLLKQFEVVSVGDVFPMLSGNPDSDWLLNLYLPVVGGYYKELTKNIANITVRKVIADVLKSFNNALLGSDHFKTFKNYFRKSYFI